MNTQTRPATESDHTAPLPTAYLSAPRLPTRCGPVEAVPVSAASPGSTVSQCGIGQIATGLTPENAIKLCDKLWRPGRVFFVTHGDGTRVTVGSVPSPSPRIVGGEP